MTSAIGTGEHPEVSEISDLTDGLLSPARAAALRDHLAGCALCEDVHASLEEIRGLLGTLPGPTRMPDDVAGRIDAALAAEALLEASAAPQVPTVSRETVDAAAAVSRETDAVPARPAAADRPTGRPRGSSGPGRRAPGGRSARMRRWPRALLGAAAIAAVFGIGGLVVQNITAGGEPGGDPGRPTTATEKSTSGTDTLTAAALGSDVRELLAAQKKTDKGAQKTPEIGTRSTPATPMRGEADTVPSCVRLGVGRPETPLAARHGTYEGKDAYLVVLPHPSDTSRVTAYVVDSSCVSATPPAPGKVLLHRSYQRN